MNKSNDETKNENQTTKNLNLVNWSNIGEGEGVSKSIEQCMLEELKSIDPESKKGIPTRHFKDNFDRIFHRTSTNPQPRLNKSMHNLEDKNLIEIKKVQAKNYIRIKPVSVIKDAKKNLPV